MVVGKGFPPFGYQFTRDQNGRTVGLKINLETAPIAQRIIKQLATRSIPTICIELNAESVPGPRGGRWRHTTIVDIARNPVYVGRFYHSRTKQPKIDGKKRKVWQDVSGDSYIPVPGIVSEADFEAAKAGLRARKTHHGRRRANTGDDPYPMRGMLVCAHCDGPLSCKPNHEFRYYACLRHFPRRADLPTGEICAGKPVPAGALEQLTWQTVIGALFDQDHLRAYLEDARLASAAARRQTERLAVLVLRQAGHDG